MTIHYKCVTRFGSYYGDIAEGMKRYGRDFIQLDFGRGSGIALAFYDEGELLRLVGISRSPPCGGENSIILAASDSMNKSIELADGLEAVLGVTFEQGHSALCRDIQKRINSHMSALRQKFGTKLSASSIFDMLKILGQDPLSN